jgi:PAS domain-containing protein
MSRQCERLFGYSQEYFLQNPQAWQDCLHPEDASAASEKRLSLIAQKQPYSLEYRVLTKDKRVVCLRESSVIMIDAGQATAVRGIPYRLAKMLMSSDPGRRDLHVPHRQRMEDFPVFQH